VLGNARLNLLGRFVLFDQRKTSAGSLSVGSAMVGAICHPEQALAALAAVEPRTALRGYSGETPQTRSRHLGEGCRRNDHIDEQQFLTRATDQA
jgi:hypothetical protein